MDILDSRFVYVPSGEQEQRGVLARWRKQREAEKEAESLRAIEVAAHELVCGTMSDARTAS